MCPTAGDRDFSFRDLAEADFDRTPIHYPTGRERLDTTRRLQQVIRFYAARDPQLGREVKDEEGRLLLESNPLRGLKTPAEKSPNRVILTQAEYDALLRVSPDVGTGDSVWHW